jgi:hypothetical protein
MPPLIVGIGRESTAKVPRDPVACASVVWWGAYDYDPESVAIDR